MALTFKMAAITIIRNGIRREKNLTPRVKIPVTDARLGRYVKGDLRQFTELINILGNALIKNQF